MRFVKVLLKRSEMEKISVDVAPWEVELLRAVHGEEAVEVQGETEFDREYPEAETEYNRLLARYKNDRDQGNVPYVEQVYGSGAAGVNTLQDAILEAQEAELNEPLTPVPVVEKPKAKVKAKPKAKRSKVAEPIEQ